MKTETKVQVQPEQKRIERTIDETKELLSKIELREQKRVFYLVHLVGRSPLLQHNPGAGLMHRNTNKRGETVIPTPEDEAAMGRYLSADGKELVLPSRMVQRSAVNAGGRFKKQGRGAGKQTLASTIAGQVRFLPENFSLGRAADEYEVDVQRAVIQKQGILRARPKLPVWDVYFVATWDAEITPLTAETLREILEEAGNAIGVGDFRPEKKGPFGRFTVESVVDVKEKIVG